MNENYLLAAARYVELNPVQARLVEKPWEYPWSSARAHMKGEDDSLAKVDPLLELAGDWGAFLSSASDGDTDSFQKHERSGRPLGGEAFVERLEIALKRPLRPQKPGPKRKGETADG